MTKGRFEIMEEPIGVIDSGVGGLTVMQEIMRQLPRENIIYLGDIARCPYGSRPKEEVRKYTWEMVDFLLGKNIKLLVIACNTATAHTLYELEEKLDIPVVGVIQPGARTAIKNSKNQQIGIIGTESTIYSEKYEKEIKKIHPKAGTLSKACPTFVPLIERGELEGEIIQEEVQKHLEVFTKNDIDTLILGCTHYPLIRDTIQDFLGEEIKIVSSGEETAREVSAVLNLYKINNISTIDPKYEFYTTGDSKLFVELTKKLFSSYIKDIENLHIKTVKL